MKASAGIILLCLSASFVFSEVPEDVIDQNAANRYTDQIIGKAVKSVVDVLELPDHNMTVAYKLLVAEIDALCRLTEGQAFNMRSLHRNRDAVIEYRKRDMLVKLPSEFQNLTVKFKVVLTVWKSVFNVKLQANVRSSEVLTTVVVARNSNVAYLEDVSVRYLSGVKLNTTGFGQVDWPVRPLAAKFVQFLNDKVATAIEKFLKNAMESVVASTLYPSVWS